MKTGKSPGPDMSCASITQSGGALFWLHFFSVINETGIIAGVRRQVITVPIYKKDNRTNLITVQ